MRHNFEVDWAGAFARFDGTRPVDLSPYTSIVMFDGVSLDPRSGQFQKHVDVPTFTHKGCVAPPCRLKNVSYYDSGQFVS